MIKGINRQIIEVTDTGNPYFERALLIVRPHCADTPGDRLRAEANRLVRTAGGYSALRRSRRRFQMLMLGGGSGLAGALAAALLITLLR
ncbi:MAG: hypothetical protein HFJ80_03625 [Clostridiales bacterium]|nr:hypothetical protein [Clostridiales bacterium]